MRRPRFRIRTMMILVALIGLVGGSTLEYFRAMEREKTRAARALHYDLSANRERNSADIIGLRIDYMIGELRWGERMQQRKQQSESEQSRREAEEKIIGEYEKDPRPLVIEKLIALHRAEADEKIHRFYEDLPHFSWRPFPPQPPEFDPKSIDLHEAGHSFSTVIFRVHFSSLPLQTFLPYNFYDF